MPESEEFSSQISDMIQTQLRRRGITDAAVLAAMESVPRHKFVPREFREKSYDDVPLPIGDGQTISQPYIVAAMTAALHVKPSDRVLEIGAGCGYQAAILSRLVATPSIKNCSSSRSAVNQFEPRHSKGADLCRSSATMAGRIPLRDELQ